MEWMASELNGDREYSGKVHESLGLEGCQLQNFTEAHLRPLKV